MVLTRVSPDPAPIVPLHCNSILADQDRIRKHLGIMQFRGSGRANGSHLPLARHDHRARLR